MIRGVFSPAHPGNPDPAPTPVPLIQTFIYVPVVDRHVSLEFLLDTGADVTVLHARDSLRLLQSPEDWAIVRAFHAEDIAGAGAGRPYYAVPAVVFLTHDDGSADANAITIWVAEPGGPNDAHASLLANYTLLYAQPDDLILERRDTPITYPPRPGAAT